MYRKGDGDEIKEKQMKKKPRNVEQEQLKVLKLQNLKIKREIVETCLDIWESGLRDFFFTYISFVCYFLIEW